MIEDADTIDYDELIDRLMNDCSISDVIDDVSQLSKKLSEDSNVTKQQFKIIMELINRLDDRLDRYMENQATSPMKEVNELKRWMKDYLDGYIGNTEDELKIHKEEIFGNGKKGLKTDVESLKTKASITLWLVGILLTGSGLSGIGLLTWMIFGG